jgi:hypothetical protein
VIDFRYHLVSIVAVFLALAIGIVVGSTALQPAVVSTFQKASAFDKARIDSLQSQNKSLSQQLGGDQAFAQANASELLSQRLTGQRVVVVTAPSADGTVVSGISSALAQAGATVTGQVALQPSFFDTSAANQSRLTGLAQRLAPSGTGSSTSQPANPQIAGQQQAAQVLAAALVTRDAPPVPKAVQAQTQTVLAGFAQPGFIRVSAASGATGSALMPAALAVVVIPAQPPSGGDSDPANAALLAVAEQLALDGHGAVLAGSVPGSGPGSAIDALQSGGGAAQLSTVDNAGTEVGQIIAVQALAELAAGGKAASYGAGPGTAPTPSASPSGSASASPSASAPGR